MSIDNDQRTGPEPKQALTDRSRHPVRLRDLFFVFFKIGLFTFGGGYAMIPLMEREIIHKRHWLSESDILDIFAISQSLPGAFALNVSSFVGIRKHGRSGSIAATLGCVLPSFLVILGVASGLSQVQDSLIVQRFFLGVRAAVTAQILMAAIKMGRQIIVDRLTAGLALAAFLLVQLLGLHPVLTILGGATAGLVLYWVFPGAARRVGQRSSEKGGR